jgi:hypothetical protein
MDEKPPEPPRKVLLGGGVGGVFAGPRVGFGPAVVSGGVAGLAAGFLALLPCLALVLVHPSFVVVGARGMPELPLVWILSAAAVFAVCVGVGIGAGDRASREVRGRLRSALVRGAGAALGSAATVILLAAFSRAAQGHSLFDLPSGGQWLLALSAGWGGAALGVNVALLWPGEHAAGLERVVRGFLTAVASLGCTFCGGGWLVLIRGEDALWIVAAYYSFFALLAIFLPRAEPLRRWIEKRLAPDGAQP